MANKEVFSDDKISSDQLRQIARQMEVAETPILSKSQVIDKINKFRQNDPLTCTKLIAPVITVAKGEVLYRIRDYKVDCPDKYGPLFFTVNTDDLFQILSYRKFSFKKKGLSDKEVDKRLYSLKLDLWQVKSDLKLIKLYSGYEDPKKNYGFNELEKNIKMIDKNYQIEYPTIVPGQVPDGSQFVPANWLSNFGCVDGWTEIPVKNEFIQEIMLTPKGLSKIKIINTVNAFQFLFEEPASEKTVDIGQ